MAAAVLLKVQLPPGSGSFAGSKTMKFAEDMSVADAVVEICKAFKIPDPGRFLIFRPAKLGWLANAAQLKSFAFEPQEALLLMSRFQAVILSRPAFTSAFASASSSSSAASSAAQSAAKKRKNLVLVDFLRPIKAIMPFVLRKLNLKGSPQRYQLTWKERDLALDADRSLFDQNVDPNYCTLILTDCDDVVESEASSSGGGDAFAQPLDLTAPLSKLFDIVKQGPLTKANRKKKWERRLFALSNGHLFYYTSTDAAPSGVIPLKGFQLRSHLDAKKKNYAFELFCQEQTAAKRNSYLIRAADELTFNQWVSVLEQATGRPMLRPDEESSSSSSAAASSAVASKKVFGGKLEDACDPGKLVPYVVLDCVKYLEQKSLKVEGVFRLSGGAQLIKQYAAAYDRGERANFDSEQDPHNVSGVLKQYFRDMDEPILTYDLYADWMAADAAGKWDISLKLGYLRQLIRDLPLRNRETLSFLFGFLVKVASHSNVNQMGYQNLATVFGPNLLKVKGGNMLALVSSTAFVNSITHSFLEYYDVIFGDAPLPAVQPFNDSDHEAPPGATPVYEFAGSNPYELPLKTGDLVYVFHKSQDGWWRGECCGRYGRFPGNYVKPLSAVAMARLLKKQTYERKMNVLVEAEQAEREKIEDLKLRAAQASALLATLQERAAAAAAQAQEARQRVRDEIVALRLHRFVQVFLASLEAAQTASVAAATVEENLATEVGTLHKALLSRPPVDPKKKKTAKQDQSHIDLVKESLGQIHTRMQTQQQTRQQVQEHRKFVVALLQAVLPVVQNIQGGDNAATGDDDDLQAVLSRETRTHSGLLMQEAPDTPRSAAQAASQASAASSSAAALEPISPRGSKSGKKHSKKRSEGKKKTSSKDKTKKK